MEQIENTITQLEGVTAVPHPRFGGRQFEWQGKEIGHIHRYGHLDILFKKDIHDALIEEGAATEHQWVPDAGWVTFIISNETDLPHALELLKFSYYQKRKRDQRENDFANEIQALALSEKVKTLI